MEQNKKIIISLLVLLVIGIIALVLFFSFQKKNKTETQIVQNQEQIKEKQKEDSMETKTGYLVKMNEKSIDFISLEKSKNNDSEEEKQKNIETFNISIIAPTTPITKGTDGSGEIAKLSDLKIGQEIVVVYNKETKDLIRININEDNKK